MIVSMHIRATLLLAATCVAADLRVGMIGTDTTHAGEFTRLINGGTIPGARVVAAYKGGSPDIESSRTRVDRFAAELRESQRIPIADNQLRTFAPNHCGARRGPKWSGHS